MTAICNGATDSALPRSDTRAVPDHAIPWALEGFSHAVELLAEFVIAPFLLWFASALNPSNSMAGTDQGAT